MAADPSEEAEDLEIAVQMMDRSEEGLRRLLVKYGPKVKGSLKKRFRDVLAEPELDEALNVAALNAWQHADQYDLGKGTLGSWFLRIARNAALDILRGESRHWRRRLEYDPASEPEVHEVLEDPPQPDSQDEKVIADLHEIVDGLPGLQRAITKADLAVGGTADSQRLAGLHGTSVGSIYVSRIKARETIRRTLISRGHFRSARGPVR